jgi:hypothetical protein
MREHATAGNKKAFHSGLPKGMKPEHKEALYHDLRKSMNIKEVFDPHLKVSEYQWGETKGANKMRDMTPGEKVNKQPVKRKEMRESRLPVLLMNAFQLKQLNEETSQLEFDGIQTKNLEMCPDAYELFKGMIQKVRDGEMIGEPAGHQQAPVSKGGVPAPETMPVLPSDTRKKMQFKYYLGL